MLSRRSILWSFAAAKVLAFARDAGIEIGVCGAVKDIAEADAAGFDYLEPGAAGLASLSDEDFAALRARVLGSHLRCKSFNSLIRTMRVVGGDANLDSISAYLHSTLDRCRQLGARVVVWGSAGSRNVPDGYSREEASKQIKSFLLRAGDIAQSLGIVLAIEPLERAESNIINTGAEAFQLVREVGHSHVKMIIDYYHMRRENEDPAIVLKARDSIVHLHFANPNGRLWPKSADEDPEYARFFEYLKRMGYRGGISIEGRGSIREDASASLAFFRTELSL